MTRSTAGFRAMSNRERQQADLFFADLMGRPHSRPLSPRFSAAGAAEGETARPEDAEADDASRSLVQHPTLGYGWMMSTTAAMTPVTQRPATGARAASASEEILGTDDRQLVADTTAIGFRFVCCLDLLFTHPSNPAQTILLRGTGTLISDRHVLTAAHNILNTLPGVASAGRRTVDRVFAAPGRNGRVLPFGESRSMTLRVTPEWTAAQNSQFDFGLITLEDALGAATQPALGGARLGFWSHPQLGGGTHIRPLEVSFLPGRPVNLDGYPVDKCRDRPANRAATAAEVAACTGTVPGNPRLTDLGSMQWRAFGSILDASPASEPRCITYDLDSAVGHSGGPIWLRWEKYRNLVAVNTGGFPRPTAPFDIIANMGVRITNDVLRTLRNWMKTDGVTATF
jgi:V8-like Glu-specific endopeptidase